MVSSYSGDYILLHKCWFNKQIWRTTLYWKYVIFSLCNYSWLILQRVTRSENSAYSSSVNRVLITRWRWGVLYLFMAVNLLSWVDFFKRRKPQKGGLGVATPTRFPQDKMSRQAKFGTVVESCSKRVAASGVLYLPLQFRRGILAAFCYISAGKLKYANSAAH